MTELATTDHETRSLTFETRGLTLRGTAYIPDRADHPFPTIVMCHGFTGNRIETGRLFVTLARRMVTMGDRCNGASMILAHAFGLDQPT